MYLNIILTILVIVLITMCLGIFFWWRKHGRKMFELMEKMKTFTEIPKINPSDFPIDPGFLLKNFFKK